MRWQIGVLVVCVALIWGCLVAGRAILQREEHAAEPTVSPSDRPSVTALATPAVSAIHVAEPPTAAEARLTLAVLPVVAREVPLKTGYLRGAFGSGWIDTDHNGCNQRDDVLLRDGVPGTVLAVTQGACEHDVVAGTWVDPYTGATLVFDDLKNSRQAQAIQIDHVVPLAEAWVSGAERWSDDRRRRFANDLAELLAVDGPANGSKGDGDPAAWRPKKAFQCEYARRWIEIKRVWRLAIDPSEKRALGELLGYCAP